jgi:hypothetical protein
MNPGRTELTCSRAPIADPGNVIAIASKRAAERVLGANITDRLGETSPITAHAFAASTEKSTLAETASTCLTV